MTDLEFVDFMWHVWATFMLIGIAWRVSSDRARKP